MHQQQRVTSCRCVIVFPRGISHEILERRGRPTFGRQLEVWLYKEELMYGSMSIGSCRWYSQRLFSRLIRVEISTNQDVLRTSRQMGTKAGDGCHSNSDDGDLLGNGTSNFFASRQLRGNEYENNYWTTSNICSQNQKHADICVNVLCFLIVLLLF